MASPAAWVGELALTPTALASCGPFHSQGCGEGPVGSQATMCRAVPAQAATLSARAISCYYRIHPGCPTVSSTKQALCPIKFLI